MGWLITETWLKIKDRKIEHMLDSKEEKEERLKKMLKIEKFKREKIRKFLVELVQVINNDCKVRDYKKYLEKITKDFEEKDIFVNSEEDKKVLSGEQIKYTFAYCIYYMGNQGKNQKVKKCVHYMDWHRVCDSYK